ncbi:hypothetical protein QBC43DRAFT_337494 [Cladorrhinum sp. PSN259]|nr:hypothetical protein QBC43DRAFT_337494 [Cladorrhinum sp. PSN259]
MATPFGGCAPVKIKQEPGVPIKQEPGVRTDMPSIPSASRKDIKIKQEDFKDRFGGDINLYSIPTAPRNQSGSALKLHDSNSSLLNIPKLNHKRRRYFGSSITVCSQAWRFRAHYNKSQGKVEVTITGSTQGSIRPDIMFVEREIFRKLQQANFQIEPVGSFGSLLGIRAWNAGYGGLALSFTGKIKFHGGDLTTKASIPVQLRQNSSAQSAAQSEQKEVTPLFKKEEPRTHTPTANLWASDNTSSALLETAQVGSRNVAQRAVGSTTQSHSTATSSVPPAFGQRNNTIVASSVPMFGFTSAAPPVATSNNASPVNPLCSFGAFQGFGSTSVNGTTPKTIRGPIFGSVQQPQPSVGPRQSVSSSPTLSTPDLQQQTLSQQPQSLNSQKPAVLFGSVASGSLSSCKTSDISLGGSVVEPPPQDFTDSSLNEKSSMVLLRSPLALSTSSDAPGNPEHDHQVLVLQAPALNLHPVFGASQDSGSMTIATHLVEIPANKNASEPLIGAVSTVVDPKIQTVLCNALSWAKVDGGSFWQKAVAIWKISNCNQL